VVQSRNEVSALIEQGFQAFRKILYLLEIEAQSL
jgi:hypothetical protein